MAIQLENRPGIAHIKPPSATRDLLTLRTPDKNYHPSRGKLYHDGDFDRDQREAVEDIIPFLPKEPSPVNSVRDLQESTLSVIKNTAKYQATNEEPDSFTEAEFGRDFHEARRRVVYGRRVTGESLKIYRAIKKTWGEVYYGQIDANPLGVRVNVQLAEHMGNKKHLDEKVVREADGKEVTVRQTVLDSLTWIENRLKASTYKDETSQEQNLWLMEYRRTNPKGHRNQRWKDSVESTVHEDGKLADHKQPIAPIEVQGLTYDALMGAARLFKDERPEDARRWTELAGKLQEATLKHFWIADREQFAMAIDRDPAGNLRQVKTPSSDPATLLNTELFDNLAPEIKQKYVSSIVRFIYSKEFVTAAGIRSRARRFRNLFRYADYHGAWAVWHKETYDIAKGMRRQGFHRLAEQAENRIVNTSNLSGGNFEFTYVDPITGRVHYDPSHKIDVPVKPRRIIGGNTPEENQLWSASAVWAIKRRRALEFGKEQPAQELWQKQLEDEVIKQAPKVEILKTRDEIDRAYPRNYAYVINERAGRRRMIKDIRERLREAA